MPKIQLNRPDGSQLDYELIEDVVTIGRAQDNVFQIDEASISSHHARISPSPDGYRLKDLGSTNGTSVNGAALTPETELTLKPGDRIRLGKVDGVFDPEHAKPTPQDLPGDEERIAAPASRSIKPSNFMNASPFQKRQRKKDRVGIVAMALGVLAILASLGVLWLVIQMQTTPISS